MEQGYEDRKGEIATRPFLMHPLPWRMGEQLGSLLEATNSMPDPRTTEGELMCPELYPAERVAKRLKRELLRDFTAQFQQQPTTETGAHFHRAWLPVRSVRPAGAPVARCRFWDLASTKQTAGHRSRLDSRRPCLTLAGWLYSVDDVVKLRDTPGVVDKTILAVTQQDGRGVRVRIEQQIGTGGVFQASAYTKLLAGYDYAGEADRREVLTRGAPSRFRPRAATSGWPRGPGTIHL